MDIRIGNNDVYAIVSSRGGIVKEFMYYDAHVIYPFNITLQKKQRGGIPICFPFFGPAPKIFSPIPQHGWLRHENLEISEHKERHVILKGMHIARASYPWNLNYEVIISLSADGELHIVLTIDRPQDGFGGQAPINPAFHPYWNNLGERQIRAGVDTFISFKKESSKIPAPAKTLINLGKLVALMQLNGAFGDHSKLTLWSDSDKYFCVEPSLTSSDVFNTPAGISLMEGASSEVSLSINVSKV